MIHILIRKVFDEGNLRFVLEDKDNGFTWTTENGSTYTTIGEATINEKTGLLTYTKIPGFYGRDSVRYRIYNNDLPERYDVGTVHIMVGNHDVEDGTLLIPNAFTPNGDGYNDRFMITGMIEDKLVNVTDPSVKSSLEVFNRWGTLVYKSKGDRYQNDWDGTTKGSMVSIGKELPNGTYFYIFKITFNLSDGKTVNKDYHGYVELRR
ncbi:MAG: gliding motility-associated C-terminal domain-containing protein [Breznakibacter sp.]